MIKKYIILTCLCFLVLLIFTSKNIYANDSDTVVSVYIQSYDKTLLSKKVSALKFKTALDSVILDEKITLIYSQNGSSTQIHSINNIKNNHFKNDDGWLGYVIRDNTIIEKDNYLSTELLNNDVVVLYYGKKGETQITSQIDITYENELLNFNVVSKRIVKDKIIVEPIKICNIVLKNNITNEKKVLVTNNNGNAYTKLNSDGEYTFYISDENKNTYPTTVRTDKFTYNHKI